MNRFAAVIAVLMSLASVPASAQALSQADAFQKWSKEITSRIDFSQRAMTATEKVLHDQRSSQADSYDAVKKGHDWNSGLRAKLDELPLPAELKQHETRLLKAKHDAELMFSTRTAAYKAGMRYLDDQKASQLHDFREKMERSLRYRESALAELADVGKSLGVTVAVAGSGKK